MTERDIQQLMERERMRRSREDREHVECLAAGATEGLHEWSARVKRIGATVVTVVLLAVPTAYAALLPSPAGSGLVACNQYGGQEAVLHCANQIFNIS